MPQKKKRKTKRKKINLWASLSASIPDNKKWIAWESSSPKCPTQQLDTIVDNQRRSLGPQKLLYVSACAHPPNAPNVQSAKCARKACTFPDL
jgi:hypothetical protein